MEIVLKTVDFKQLSNLIIRCSENIRFVGIIDTDGIVHHKQKNTSDEHCLVNEIELFEVDQPIIKNIQAVFDHCLGKVQHMAIYRESISQIIHYVDNNILYISINSENEQEFYNVSHKIRLILKKEIETY